MKKIVGLAGIIFFSIMVGEAMAGVTEESWDQKITAMITATQKNRNRLSDTQKTEILSWRAAGIRAILRYRLDDNLYQSGVLKEFLELFGKEALPVLEEALAENDEIIFARAVCNYWSLVKESPPDAKRFFARAEQWRKIEKAKFLGAATCLVLADSFFDTANRYPQALAFLELLLADQVEINDDYTHMPWCYWTYLRENSIPPFFDRFLENYFAEQEGMVFKTFWEIIREICMNFPDQTKTSEQPPNMKEVLQEFDLRDQGAVIDIFAKRLLPENETSQRDNRLDLPKTFPIDRTTEGVEFLQYVIRRDQGKMWADAACILRNFLTGKEMNDFIESLLSSGQMEKSNYLKELADIGCGEFISSHSRSLLQSFQPVSKDDMMPSGPYYYSAEEVFKAFLESQIAAIRNGGTASRRVLTAVARNGTLLEKIYALDLLADIRPEIPDAYFIDWLRRDNNPWIKAAALSALQKHRAAVPTGLLPDLLRSDNPFLVWLAVASVPQRGDSRLDAILHELVKSGDPMCQHLVLEKICERSGYDALHAMVQEVPREKQSLLTRIFLLNQYYLHRDASSLQRLLTFNERPEIMIPAAAALFELDRTTAIAAILQLIEGGPELMAKKRSSKEISQEDITIYSARLAELLARSRDPSVLPAMFKLLEASDDYLVENAVEAGLQLFPENTIREIKTRFASAPRILSIIEKALQKKLEDAVARCKAEIVECQRGKNPETPASMIDEAFAEDDRSTWQWELENLLEAKPVDPVGELLAYARGNHEATSLNAMKLLLDFPPEPRIAALMREKLDAPQLHLRIPPLIWLARQQSPEALPRFLAISDESVCRPVVEKILSPNPTAAGLDITLQLIAKRRYDLWRQLDNILAAYARAKPGLILSALNTTDTVTLSKLVKAGREIADPTSRRQLKRFLVHEDAAVAVKAFFCVRDLLTAGDRVILAGLYQRLKDEVVRGEILETLESLGSNSIRLPVQDQEKVLGLYRRMQDRYHDSRGLLELLEKGQGLPLYVNGVARLNALDPVLGAKLIFRHHAAASDKFRHFYFKEDKTLDEAIAKPVAPSLKIPTKLDPVRETFFARIPRNESQCTRQSTLWRLRRGYIHLYMVRDTGSGDKNADRIHLRFSPDLKQWTTPLSWKEPLRVEDLKLLELADGRLVLYYLKCNDPQVLSHPRPYMVLIGRDHGIEKGFFPLPEGQAFSNISLIYFKNRYVLAAIPEDNCCCNDESSELLVFTSPDLLQWTPPSPKTTLAGPAYKIDLRILGNDPHVFLVGSGRLYRSSDLKNWDKLALMQQYTIADIQPCPMGNMAVLTSNRLAFWGTYLSFSRDLREWSRPLYTGIPHALAGFWDGDHPVLLLEDRILSLDMGALQGDADQDGLTDLEEQALFTDGNNPDTDGDGQIDNQDKNPLRKPAVSASDRQQIRQAVVQDYMAKAEKYGFGGLLIVVGEGEETQSIEGLPYTVLFFSPADFQAYQEFHADMGNFYRLHFEKVGLAEDNRSATVLFSYRFHGKAAASYHITLRKMNGLWQIISFKTLWVS